MTPTPPVTITRETDDESGETITYTCGTAILYRDYPGEDDRLSLSLGSGEHRRRSELREWAALFTHPAVQDVIAGDDTDPEPEPAGKVTLRYADWQRVGSAASPSMLLTWDVVASVIRQNPTLQLTDKQQNQVVGIIVDRIDYLFGLTTGETENIEDPTYMHGFIDGFEQGKRAGEREALEAIRFLVEKVEGKQSQEAAQ